MVLSVYRLLMQGGPSSSGIKWQPIKRGNRDESARDATIAAQVVSLNIYYRCSNSYFVLFKRRIN